MVDPEFKDTIERNQTNAPISVSSIARELGVKVIASTLSAGISGEIRPDPEVNGSYVIRVNRHDSKARQRFTVAHELSHFMLHRNLIGSGITDDVLYRSNVSDAVEAQANRLAADILMPHALVSQWIENAKSFGVENIPVYLAEKFEVSEGAMKIRLGLV